MTATETIVATIVAGVAIVASSLVWGWIVARWNKGREPLFVEPRSQVPWRPAEVILVVAISVLLQLVALQTLQHTMDIDPDLHFEALNSRDFVLVNLGGIVAQIVALAVAMVLMPLTCGATRIDMGFDTRQLRRDFRIGLVSFVAIVPPVYLLQALLYHFFPEQHPYIDKLRASPETGSFLVISISVLLVAPLVEEFLFRVLLQGWLERQFGAPFGRGPSRGSAAGMDHETNEGEVSNSGGPLSAFSFQRAAPILISAVIFASLHLRQGPAPIPLFFLAIGLGYLYQCTHRIWPSLFVHLLLNAATLVMLWFELR
jgi:membrane protease YdiL (CAAX protease family)